MSWFGPVSKANHHSADFELDLLLRFKVENGSYSEQVLKTRVDD